MCISKYVNVNNGESSVVFIPLVFMNVFSTAESLSIQPPHPIHIPGRERQDKVPAPAFLIEVHPEHLPAREGNLVEGEDQPPFGGRADGAEAVGLPGEDSLLVLKPPAGAALALHRKARRGQLVAHRRVILQGNQKEQHIVLDKDVLAPQPDAVFLRPQMVKFLFHSRIVR